jgi:Methyltransferase domain
MDIKGPFGLVTDKVGHGYLPAYLQIAAELGPRARVCELGVWRGASLRLWQALFPLGEVTGVDSDSNSCWPEGSRRVVMSQDDPELPGVLGSLFDLVVDDASHSGLHSARAFELLWPLVAPGGYYVVEDWYIALDEEARRFYSGTWEAMLELVQGFLLMLTSPDAECESVRYQYGLAIVRRRP